MRRLNKQSAPRRILPVAVSPTTRRQHSSLLAMGLVLLLTLPLAPGCASLEVDRDTETTGTFVSKSWAFTFLGWDLPQSALDIARENASDTRLANLVVEEAKVWPDLGPFDWLLEIIGFRKALVRGRWGYSD